MIKAVRTSIIVVLSVFLAACAKTATRQSAEDCLAAAERLHQTSPDSVKAYEDLLRTAMREAEDAQRMDIYARACLRLSAQLQWTDEHEAITLAQRAQQAIERAESTDEMANLRYAVKLTLAGLYEQTEDLARARSLYHDCLSDSASHQVALSRLANLSLTEGDAEEALRIARGIQATDTDTADIEPLFILANCYLQCDSLGQARTIYEKLCCLPNAKAQYIAERHLAEIAIMEGDLDSLPVLLDSAFASAEAVFFDALQQKDVYFHATLEQERQTERLAYRQKLALWALVAISLVAVLVVAFVIMMSRHRRAIHLQRLETEQRERELMQERLEQQEQKIELLQHFILEKNEVLRRLREEGDSKKQLSAREWLDVEQLLDNTTGGFVTRLRAQHPEFNEEDIQLCMLTRMKLTNQVIASIYLITVSAVKHRKLKLKKNGFGETDPERPLDDVLLTI